MFCKRCQANTRREKSSHNYEVVTITHTIIYEGCTVVHKVRLAEAQLSRTSYTSLLSFTSPTHSSTAVTPADTPPR